MTTANIILALANGLTGLLCIGLAIPLIRRKVRRNHLYGVRIRKSFQSDAHWYAINEFGGRALAVYGGALVIVGLVALVPAVPAASWPFWLILLAPVILLIPTVTAIVRFANALPDVM